MGFINNHKDAFLPNNHPWDDTTTNYSVPSQPSQKRKLSDLSYDDLKSMLDEMSAEYKSMPMCKAKISLKAKMMAVIQEIKQRDELEEATSEERQDSFEPPIDGEGSFDTSSPGIDANFEDTIETDNFMIEDDLLDEEDELFEDEDEDDEDLLDEEEDYSPNEDVNKFLIAALIVITLIAITKK